MAENRDPDTPTDTEPKQMTSTPFSSDSKPNVAEMFKKMGDKLGWFQYNNLETAYKTLSKSSKKKSTKSRVKKETPNRRKDEELSKAKHKENQTLGKDREQHKLSFNTSPLKENHSQNISSEDFLEPVPPRKSKACTDLTKEWRVTQNCKKKLSRISIIPSAEPENISHGLITHGDKRYSISNADVGCPIQESTRIHSRQSIDNLLDVSEDSNQSSEGRNQTGELKQNISEEDSYRHLHIMKKCPNVGDSEVIDAMNLLKINKSKEEETQFYTTAHCEVLEQDLFQTVMEGEDKSHNDISKSERHVEESNNIQSVADSLVERVDGSDSSSYVELVDASAQVEKSCLSNSENVEHNKTTSNSSQSDSHMENSEISGRDSFCEEIVKVTEIQGQENVSEDQVQESSDSSYIEIADASLQTSVISHSQKNHKQELESDSSYVEVEERSLQTSTTNFSQKEENRSTFSGSEWDQISSENNDQVQMKEGNSDNNVTESQMKCDRIFRESNSSASNTRFSSDEDGSSDDSFTYLKKKVNPKKNDIRGKEMEEKISVIKNLNTDRITEKCSSHLDDSLPDIIPSKTHNVKKSETRNKTDDHCAGFTSDSENDVHDNQDSGVHKFEEVISSDSDIDLPDSTSAGVPSMEDVLSSDSDKDLQRITGAKKQGSIDVLSSDSDDFLSDKPYKNRKKTSVKKDPKTSSDHWRTPKHYRSDSSTDEEELESFFQKIKSQKSIPQEETPPKNKSLDDFIVDDDDMSSSENEAEFYITTNTVFTTPHRKVEPIVLDDSEDDIFKSDIKPIKRKTKEKSQKTPASNRKRTETWEKEEDRGKEKYSFLKSLSTDTLDELADREALRYSKNFKKMKEDLTKKLFKIYNDSVFDNQLPEDLQILWNNRLLKTAGYCVYRKNAKVHDSKTVRIELSTKVCDSAERVRDTLIHELCHAAVWLLHGKNDGHGPYWRIWAKKANLTHPEIPVIARCHSYSISTKYTYQCSKCGYSIGRHSKSLDTSRKVCGFCHGEFVLLNNQQMSRGSGSSTPATPRTPNKFAMYVKENYGTVKEKEKDLKHGDIMKLLGKQFAEKNKISS